MKLTKEIIYNLANIFFNYYTESEQKKNALSILKIFDLEYNEKINRLLYVGEEPYMITPEEVSDFTSKITPLSLTSFDIECIETVLNKYEVKVIAPSLSPIFDAIGWILRLDVDKYRIHFIGGCDYDIWNEPVIPWDYDLEDDACDWKSGNDWADGFDLSKDLPKNWLDEQYFPN